MRHLDRLMLEYLGILLAIVLALGAGVTITASVFHSELSHPEFTAHGCRVKRELTKDPELYQYTIHCTNK